MIDKGGDIDPTCDYSVLQDENASREGDLYIRSVSFSPDGKHLATGAEDKQIRVSNDTEIRWEMMRKTKQFCFRFGISKRNVFAEFFKDMNKTFIPSSLVVMAAF